MQIPDIRCRQSGILLRAGPLANRHLGFPELNVNYLLLRSRNGSIVKLLQIRRYPPFSIAHSSFPRPTVFPFFAAIRGRIARRRSEEGSGVNNRRERNDGGETYLPGGKTEENPRPLQPSSFLRRVERADDLPAGRWVGGWCTLIFLRCGSDGIEFARHCPVIGFT